MHGPHKTKPRLPGTTEKKLSSEHSFTHLQEEQFIEKVLHWTSQDMQKTFPLQQVARGEGLLAAQRDSIPLYTTQHASFTPMVKGRESWL